MKMKVSKKRMISFAIILALYACLSALIGFPLGFGKMMARGMVKEYCNIVYPQAALGATRYNPISSSCETAIDLGDEQIYIGTVPTQDTVDDVYREQLFLQETGASEVISKLFRTYVQGRYYRFLSCGVYWKYNDPMTPIANLRFDYGDYDSPQLLSEEQIKELISPIALDCITQIEKILPLKEACFLYYHPDFNPDEKGMTWRIMEIPLDNDMPRTKALLDKAELRMN